MRKFMLYAIVLLVFGMQKGLLAESFSLYSIPPALNYFFNCFAIDQEESSGLILITKDVEGGECGIEKIGLVFDYNDSVDLQGARRLIAEAVESMLAVLNNQEKLSHLFAVFPMTPKELEVRIRLKLPYCGFNFPPLGNISYISELDGIVYYGTLNSYSYHIDPLRMEPYSSVLKLTTTSP